MTSPIYVGDIPIVTRKQMRPRDKDDFYETDIDCLRAYLKDYPVSLNGKRVLDPGAGSGVYGRVIRELYPYAHITGVEYNGDRFMVNNAYNEWIFGDFLELDEGHHGMYDVILGNPPYKHAEAFYWKAKQCGKPGAVIDFLLRLGFLESEGRYKSMWTTGNEPYRVTVLNTRPSFTGDGKTYPAAFAFFTWITDPHMLNTSRLRFMTFERNMNANS